MIDFIEAQGSALIAHRLRRSSDRIVDQIGGLFAGIGIDVPPRGTSMLLLIDEAAAPIGIVEIARRLRLSHPLIVRMAREFEALGLVTVADDPKDARRRRLVPTAKARGEADTIRALNRRVGAALDEVFATIGCPLAAVLDRLDAALTAAPLADRLARSPDKDER